MLLPGRDKSLVLVTCEHEVSLREETQQLHLGPILLLAPHQDGDCQAKVGLQHRNPLVSLAVNL